MILGVFKIRKSLQQYLHCINQNDNFISQGFIFLSI
jgi:hypothetical protein